MTLSSISNAYFNFINTVSKFDGIAPLLVRLYLAPVFIQAGWTKFINFDATVQWFGNSEWGLSLPFPELMAALAASSEFIGGWFLLFGFFTRLVSLPLMVTMLVATFGVHGSNGWLAISDASSWFANGTLFYNEAVMSAVEKKQMAIDILKQHGNYEWLTSSGSFTILNNGVEFSVTYFIMLLVLFCYGAGRFTSVDYFLTKRLFEHK